ncbi:MAG: flagellar biosynthesis protein FlgA [Robiginitomaculum sp.]|nr:MAG: flagellar biosynthesis protein FlgA [Robiginitomaculum sp.]
MKLFLSIFISSLLLWACAFSTAHAQVKVKDLVDVEGVRGNDLVGYGLVIGLNGSGDTIRNSPYTEEALSNLLERLGVNIQGSDFRPNNVAAVIITATLPAFARVGSRIDINVSSIGDAKNLAGGTLVMTPLNAADGNVYAVAQGSVLISGFLAEGDGASVTEGVPTSGTIPGGALIEKEIGFSFASMSSIRLALRAPDFTTASRVESVINDQYGKPLATMLDAGTVELNLTGETRSPAALLAMIENYTLMPAQKARVVIDQRSGTIVLSTNVKVSAVAIAQGNLSITIAEAPEVSQPNPFAPGETMVVPRTSIQINDGAPGNIGMIESNVTLADLVAGLNSLGVSPREMMDILKTMKTAGALHAELILQ